MKYLERCWQEEKGFKKFKVELKRAATHVIDRTVTSEEDRLIIENSFQTITNPNRH